MTMMDLELSQLSLPKWPQMYTTGARVSVEQAREIIRRTDSFFALGYGGNNKALCHEIRSLLRMGPDRFSFEYNGVQRSAPDFWKQAQDHDAAWRTRWGIIHTQYVHNSWLSNAFVYGPQGWCHPDGGIGFVDNVGKWPSVVEVFEDWVELAKHFPFLDVGVTLMDAESCEEHKPVVSIRVKDGTAELVDPRRGYVHEGHPPAERTPEGTRDDVKVMLSADPMRETHPLVYSWVRAYWMDIVKDWPRFT